MSNLDFFNARSVRNKMTKMNKRRRMCKDCKESETASLVVNACPVAAAFETAGRVNNKPITFCASVIGSMNVIIMLIIVLPL